MEYELSSSKSKCNSFNGLNTTYDINQSRNCEAVELGPVVILDFDATRILGYIKWPQGEPN